MKKSKVYTTLVEMSDSTLKYAKRHPKARRAYESAWANARKLFESFDEANSAALELAKVFETFQGIGTLYVVDASEHNYKFLKEYTICTGYEG